MKENEEEGSGVRRLTNRMNPGRFGRESFRPGRFGLGRFGLFLK